MEHIRISYLYSHMTFKLVFRVVGWIQIMRNIDDIQNYKLTQLFSIIQYILNRTFRNYVLNTTDKWQYVLIT